jgi:hypothetical protein
VPEDNSSNLTTRCRQIYGTKRKPLAELTPEERKLVEFLEWSSGRELTQQEVNLALDQARELGEL